MAFCDRPILLRSLFREDGQTMAEYGVVLALITLGVVAALGLLATALSGTLAHVSSTLVHGLPVP